MGHLPIGRADERAAVREAAAGRPHRRDLPRLRDEDAFQRGKFSVVA